MRRAYVQMSELACACVALTDVVPAEETDLKPQDTLTYAVFKWSLPVHHITIYKYDPLVLRNIFSVLVDKHLTDDGYDDCEKPTFLTSI